ncbi:MAG: hypothetical protein JWM07_247 [Candidatus Saccharibacteria bacterium]|nr:hypothetical protein [Candidatus Saccharibacteria bacterium]
MVRRRREASRSGTFIVRMADGRNRYLVGTGLLLIIHRLLIKFGITRKLDNSLGKYAKAIPYIVRYTTGLLLVINAAKGLLFAPNVPTDVHVIAPVLSMILATAGVMLIIGFKIRWAATVMLLAYFISLVFVRPLLDVLDLVEYVGIGLYLLLYGKNYLNTLTWHERLQPLLNPESLLRIFVGIGLMTLAMSEKLLGVGLSADFLQQHNWNMLQGIGVSDRLFIIVAGITEFVVGLTLVLNIAPRLTTAIVAALMTLTAILLGVEDIFGHLFALSLVAVVWLRNELPDSSIGKRSSKSKSVK